MPIRDRGNNFFVDFEDYGLNDGYGYEDLINIISGAPANNSYEAQRQAQIAAEAAKRQEELRAQNAARLAAEQEAARQAQERAQQEAQRQAQYQAEQQAYEDQQRTYRENQSRQEQLAARLAAEKEAARQAEAQAEAQRQAQAQAEAQRQAEIAAEAQRRKAEEDAFLEQQARAQAEQQAEQQRQAQAQAEAQARAQAEQQAEAQRQAQQQAKQQFEVQRVEQNPYENIFEDRPTVGLSAMERRNELANMLAEQNKPAEPANAATIDALAKQILGQGLTNKWSGQGLGSAEANARDMAKIMADIGITDIKQFGPINQQVQEIIGTDDGGNPIYETQTQRTFGNKLTGQVVPLTYSGRQTGNFFGGTFEGKGNTGYGVQFGPDGTPYFYTQGASSNDLANLIQDMGPLGQIGLAIATGGLSIPQQIAAQMAVQVLSGKDIGDAVKGAAVSLAMANIPGSDLMKEGSSFIKDLGLPADITKTLNSSFQNAAMSGAKALLTGQDIGDAVLAGAATGGMNGAINAITGSIDGFKDLTPTQKNMVVNAVTGVISGRPLDQIIINSAIAAANAEIYGSKNPTKSSADLQKEDPLSPEEQEQLIENRLNTAISRLQISPEEEEENRQRLIEELERTYGPESTTTLPSLPTRSLGEPQVEEADDFLKSIGINTIDKPSDSELSNQDILNLINADNEVLVTSNRDTVGKGVSEDIFRNLEDAGEPPSLTPAEKLPELVMTGNRDTVGKGVSEDIFKNLEDAGEPLLPLPVADSNRVEIVGNRPPAYLPTDDDFPATPIENAGELTIVGDKQPTTSTPAPTTPVSTPTPKVPTSTKAPTVPAANPPSVTLPSFTPSGGYASTETIDPIYAGAMGDFNLFATLEELLASDQDKKDNTKPNVKTKMATGGHLDDLLVEQFSVDDLLKLLR